MIRKVIEHSGKEHLTIQGNDAYEFVLQPRSTGQLQIHIEGFGKLELKLSLEAGSHWDVLIVHSGAGDMVVGESVILQEDANLKLSYGQFTKGTIEKTTQYNLKGQGAHLETLGAILGHAHFDWTLQSNHLAKNTYASLNTNLVLQKQGQSRLEVVGSIPKGFSQSKTHQMSKILNLGEQSKASVYPKLLIDENDVEASHAASVGQPEEEHIYYLMSRGLSYDAAMGLLIKGYLHPVVAGIQDEDLRNTLFNIIDEELNI